MVLHIFIERKKDIEELLLNILKINGLKTTLRQRRKLLVKCEPSGVKSSKEDMMLKKLTV